METKTKTNVIIKIDLARKKIKGYNLKKAGWNTHSKYAFYTPEQVNDLVTEACDEQKLFNSYELIRTEYGLEAQLTVIDLENTESSKTYSLATEIPSITATNIAQQLGGAVTYSHRYLLMSIYDIVDNTLDFDTDQSDKKEPKEPKKENVEIVEREIRGSEVEKKWNGKIYKGDYIFIDNIKIKPPKEQIDKLKTHPKYKTE